MQQISFHFKEQDITRAAKQFLQIVGEKKHFAMHGVMGAGKTTFIKAVCIQLGTSDLVSSPTFAIVNEYFSAEGLPIFHFDFYRIKDPVELLDIGFDEYCTTEGYCFIEWPEIAKQYVPDDFVNVVIEETESGARKLSFSL